MGDPAIAVEERTAVKEVPITDVQVMFYHTKVKTISMEVMTTDHTGKCYRKQKFTQLQNDRATFCGIILPTDDEENVRVFLGAAKPNPLFKEVFVKSRGRKIAHGRAITAPIGSFVCPRGDARGLFIEIANKLFKYAGEPFVKTLIPASVCSGQPKWAKTLNPKVEAILKEYN